MISSISDLQIVRFRYDPSAPTGESTLYECEDGSIWHDLGPFESIPETGLTIARRIADRIRLKPAE